MRRSPLVSAGGLRDMAAAKGIGDPKGSLAPSSSLLFCFLSKNKDALLTQYSFFQTGGGGGVYSSYVEVIAVLNRRNSYSLNNTT